MKFQNKTHQFTIERQVDGSYCVFVINTKPEKFLGFITKPAGVTEQLILSEYDSYLERLETESMFSIEQVLSILASKRAKPIFGVELTPQKIKNKLENLNVKKFSESYDS